MTSPPRRAAFLDRDGVINVDVGYVGRQEDFTFIDGVKGALARLTAANYLLVVVTNQSGIARGYYSDADFAALTAYMNTELAAADAPISRVFYCPHLPEDQQSPGARCTCRKPLPGMMLAAAAELDIDLSRSIMIGDKPSDMAAGRAAEVGHCFLIDPDGQTLSSLADARFATLADCVAHLLA